MIGDEAARGERIAEMVAEIRAVCAAYANADMAFTMYARMINKILDRIESELSRASS